MKSHFVPRASAAIGAAGMLMLAAAAPSFADVSQDQARQIVTDKYGGDIISVESDSEQGQPTWEVEVQNSPNYGRIEVDVAQSSGDIINCDAEDGEGSCNGDWNGASGSGQGGNQGGGSDQGGNQGGNQGGDNQGADQGGNGQGADQNGNQVAQMPRGGADTGVSVESHSNAGEVGATIAVGAGVAAAAGASVVWLRRRHRAESN